MNGSEKADIDGSGSDDDQNLKALDMCVAEPGRILETKPK
jgi:hypothetical protein